MGTNVPMTLGTNSPVILETDAPMILGEIAAMILGTNALNANPNPNRQGVLIYQGCLNLPVNEDVGCPNLPKN